MTLSKSTTCMYAQHEVSPEHQDGRLCQNTTAKMYNPLPFRLQLIKKSVPGILIVVLTNASKAWSENDLCMTSKNPYPMRVKLGRI